MIILDVLSENTVQCPKTLFLCLLYIYTFPIASFRFFVQWVDLGSKNPLQLANSGYQDNKSFGTKVEGGSLDFNVTFSYRYCSDRFCINFRFCQSFFSSSMILI